MTRSPLLVALFAVLATVPARAAEPAYATSLRVTVCGTKPDDRESITQSGLIFRREGKAYVVTSSGPFAGAQAKLCAEVGLKGESYRPRYVPARLVAQEWGYDLALLELEQGAGQDELLELEPLLQTPFDTTWRRPSQQIRSERHFIPLLDQAIESRNGRFALSDVGGPILNAQDPGRSVGIIQGLVSDQFLRLVPGLPSQILAWRFRDSLVEPAVIVIPIEAVKAWLASYFADPEHYIPAMELVTPGQYGTGAIVRTGRLQFKENCDTHGDWAGSLGPIGGGAGGGHGIGGDDRGESRCLIEASLSPAGTAARTRWAFPRRKDFHDRLVAALERGEHPRFKEFRRRNRITGGFDRRVLGSIEAFCTLMGAPDTEPVCTTERCFKE